MNDVVRMAASAKTETDIAVLQVQVKNVDDKVGEIKEDIRELKESMVSSNNEIKEAIKELKNASEEAHRKLGDKISSLENWRWMIVGALMLLGTIGFDSIKAFIKS